VNLKSYRIVRLFNDVTVLAEKYKETEEKHGGPRSVQRRLETASGAVLSIPVILQ